MGCLGSSSLLLLVVAGWVLFFFNFFRAVFGASFFFRLRMYVVSYRSHFLLPFFFPLFSVYVANNTAESSLWCAGLHPFFLPACSLWLALHDDVSPSCIRYCSIVYLPLVVS